MIRKAVLMLGVMSLCISQSFAATPISINLSAHTPVNATLRSAVVPGWGQYFNGQETKGYVVFSGFVLTALSSYLLYSKANNTYSDYEKQGVKNGSLYSDYETQSNQAMAVSLVAAGIWVYGMVDAYIKAAPAAEMSPYTRAEGFRLAANDRDLSLTYNKRF